MPWSRLGLAAHAVVVVVELDDGKAALIAVLPKIVVLIHGSKVHCLVNRGPLAAAPSPAFATTMPGFLLHFL